MGFDWRKSKAHLLLLSKFIHATHFADYLAGHDLWKNWWNNELGEPSGKAIKRFGDEGMLMTATDLNDLLSYKYKVPELKDMLKQRSLPVSGNKDELIQRLVQADPDGMKKAVAELSLLKCTQRGHEIAERYVEAEKENRSQVECQVIDYLVKRMFREASLTVANYEAGQVFARGMGIDWKHYNPNRDIQLLQYIYGNKPEILNKLDDTKLDSLQLGAGMMLLWGEHKATKWIPKDFETGLSMNTDVAARMLLFHAQNKAKLMQFKEEGVKYVEVLGSPDSCESCNKMAGKQYKLSDAPKLPNPNCTHEMGCRCNYLASE